MEKTPKILLIEEDAQTTGILYKTICEETYCKFLEITKLTLINRLKKAGWIQQPNKLFYRKNDFFVYNNKNHKYLHILT